MILRLGDEEKHSKTKEEGGQKVSFNETFSFKSHDNRLKITLLDQDTFCDDTLGEGQLDLTQYRGKSSEQQGKITLIQLSLFSIPMGRQQRESVSPSGTKPEPINLEETVEINGEEIINSEVKGGKEDGEDKEDREDGEDKEDKEAREDLEVEIIRVISIHSGALLNNWEKKLRAIEGD